MAGTFGRGRSKFQSGGSCTSNKKCKAGSARNQQPIRNKCKASLKAGKNHNRGLTLDPQRNYHHHLLQQPPHHPHHQNLILNSRRHITNQRGENQEDQESHPHQFHIQFQQHLYPQQEQQRKQQSYTALDTELLNPLQPPKKRSCLPPLPPPPPSSLTLSEHARKMGEPQHPHQHHQQAAATPSRAAMRGGGGGEIVEVQGGHIVRSTGRKDRHSKVCTAKGPRDRRVRLAAHTAIQFYDVQDRLGYDRPSKAVDWLIKKAKAAIDQLAELPPWNPTTTSMQPPSQEIFHCENKSLAMDDSVTAFSCQGESPAFPAAIRDSEQFSHQQVEENENANNISSSKIKYNSGSGFLPASLDTDNIAETIKTFFPVEATTTSFQSYLSAPPDLGRQDLRLSLQSFQDPIMLHHQPQSHHEPVLYAGTAASALGFDGGSGWSEHQHQQQNHHSEEQRLLYAGGNSGHGGGFVFNTPATVPVPVPAFGQLFSQRGPLQSSNTPSVRAWIDPSVDHHHHHHHYLSQLIHQGSVAGGGGFSSGFSGFRIPARIQGEEEHDGVSDKPSSASSDSRH